MNGRAAAPAAGTILNALATGYGSAFAIDEYVRASVRLDAEPTVTGRVSGHPDADTALIEACVSAVTDRFDGPSGGVVETESDVAMASGLKSSSAAANATVLATLEALGEADSMSREEAARLGVDVAREVGVTVTGAYDDASASMLGGVTITNNRTDEILHRDTISWDVAVLSPPEASLSAEADVNRCERVRPMANLVRELAADGRYGEAMTANGFAFSAALSRSPEPMIEALPDVAGVSLSGTGPSYVAVGTADEVEEVLDRWSDRDGSVIRTTTQTEGARIE
ncbi:MAG: shikimate kinase [Halodesulfurarchaeum sp.]